MIGMFYYTLAISKKMSWHGQQGTILPHKHGHRWHSNAGVYDESLRKMSRENLKPSQGTIKLSRGFKLPLILICESDI